MPAFKRSSFLSGLLLLNESHHGKKTPDFLSNHGLKREYL